MALSAPNAPNRSRRWRAVPGRSPGILCCTCGTFWYARLRVGADTDRHVVPMITAESPRRCRTNGRLRSLRRRAYALRRESETLPNRQLQALRLHLEKLKVLAETRTQPPPSKPIPRQRINDRECPPSVADSTWQWPLRILPLASCGGITVIDKKANVGDRRPCRGGCRSRRVRRRACGPARTRRRRASFANCCSPHTRLGRRRCPSNAESPRFLVDPLPAAHVPPDAVPSAVAGPNHRAVNATVCSLDSELLMLPAGIDAIEILTRRERGGRILEGARRLSCPEARQAAARVRAVDAGPAGCGHQRRMAATAAGRIRLSLPSRQRERRDSCYDERIAVLPAGTLRSSALNVMGHPRRWPSRRWLAVAPPAPCALAPARRELCRPWGGPCQVRLPP